MTQITVHHRNGTSTLASTLDETWARLCQRYCESRLLHPPKLLQLLTSLSPNGRAEEYVFRYGEGYATIIRPAWHTTNNKDTDEGTDGTVNEGTGGRVEANLALRPRGGPLAGVEDLTHALVEPPTGANGKRPGKMAVELTVEKVGMSSGANDNNSNDNNGGNNNNSNSDSDSDENHFTGSHASNNIGPFPLTQTPYPTDDARTHVLEVTEHAIFPGVVDRYALMTLAEWRERQQKPQVEKGGRGGANVEGGGDGAGEENATPATSAKKMAAAGRKERASSKKGAVAKALEEEKSTTPTKGKAKTAAEGSPAPKKAARKSAGKAAEAEAEAASPAPSKAAAASTATKAAKKTPKKKDRGASTAKGAPTNGTGRKEEKVKRPLNGYMRFCAEYRPGIMEDHPGLRAIEVSAMLGERYRALDADEKRRYTDAAREALVQFKKDHPDLPKGTRKKKKTEAVPKDDEADEEEREEAPKGAKKRKKKEAVKDAEEVPGEEEGRAREVPKRPLNAYTSFMKQTIPKIREEHPDLPQKEVMGKAAEAYRELGDDERQRYKDAAVTAMAKFKEEYGEDAMKLGKRKKKRQSTDDDAEPSNDDEGSGEEEGDREVPKRPLNAYTSFMKQTIPKIREEHPDMPQKEVMGKAAEAYRELGDDERQRYKDAAVTAMAKFKEEYGEKALKNGKKKKKRKSTDDAEPPKNKKKRQSTDGGAENGEPAKKKKKKRQSTDSSAENGDAKRKRAQSMDLSHIPAKPAKGLPDGWVTRSVPRKSGDREDMFWFSPAESYKFRSKAEVKRYRKCLKEAGGDEAKAMKLYKKEEKSTKSAKKGKKEAVKEEALKEEAPEEKGGSSEKEDGSDGSDEEEEPEAWGA